MRSWEINKDHSTIFELVFHDQDGASDIRINGEKILKSSELASCLPTIVLSPESINLLIGSPVKKKKFYELGNVSLEPLFKDVWERANRCLNKGISFFSVDARGAMS